MVFAPHVRDRWSLNFESAGRESQRKKCHPGFKDMIDQRIFNAIDFKNRWETRNRFPLWEAGIFDVVKWFRKGQSKAIIVVCLVMLSNLNVLHIYAAHSSKWCEQMKDTFAWGNCSCWHKLCLDTSGAEVCSFGCYASEYIKSKRLNQAVSEQCFAKVYMLMCTNWKFQHLLLPGINAVNLPHKARGATVKFRSARGLLEVLSTFPRMCTFPFQLLLVHSPTLQLAYLPSW